MNRDEALAKFIREHQLELADRRATKQVVKSLRQSFFEKQKLPAAARFSNYDVANRVVMDLARARRGRTVEEITELASQVPFVLEEMTRADIAEVVSSDSIGKESQLTVEDLRKLRVEDYLTRVETEFRQRAYAEAEVKLEEDRRDLERARLIVQQKERALDAIRSELDSLPPETNLDSLVEDEEEAQPSKPLVLWWKEMGLENDPFWSNQGLAGIPEAKYDDVVVQTPVVKSYLERLDQTPDELLGKTIIILGEFGSGKTTLLQLVAYRAGRLGILPILAFVNPDPSVSKLTRQLISQVSTSVSSASRKRSEDLPVEAALVQDEMGLCVQSMSAAVRAGTTKGFLLCVDGLHKSETYQRQSLEFLQQLQNFQERLGQSKVACGVLVAGSPAWQTELKANPSLSGSFYRIDTVPPLAEESAVEAVVRRIQSFAAPDMPRPVIVKAPLRKAFQVLSARLLRPPTFRDYLDHVRDRFVTRDYASVGISLALHTETIEAVQRAVKSSPLARAFEKLAAPADHSRKFRQALKRILPEIYIREGVPETDPLFRTNRGTFLVLRREGFIVPRVAPERRWLIWHVSQELVAFLVQVYESNRIPPADALEAMFSDPIESLPHEAETIYGHIKRQLGIMTATWRSSWSEIADLLEKATAEVARVEKASESVEKLFSLQTIEDVQASLRNVIKAIALATSGRSSKTDGIAEWFGDLWCAPENAEAIIELLDRSSPLPRNASECFGVLHQHAQALSDLCTLLANLVSGEGVARLTGRFLSRDDLLKLHEARTLFLAQQYAESVDRLCSLAEVKIRGICYLLIRCALGPRAPSALPLDIRDRLQQARGHPRTKRPLEENFFYDVSRSEYSKILFQRGLVEIFLGPAVSDRDRDALKEYLELLFSLGDRVAHRDTPAYFRKHSTEIADVLKTSPKFCEDFNHSAERVITGAGFEYRKANASAVQFSFGVKTSLAPPHRMDAAQVEAAVFEILALLASGPLTLPPIEKVLDAVKTTPEGAIGIVRACVSQNLITLTSAGSGVTFALELRLTELGRTRLQALERFHTR